MVYYKFTKVPIVPIVSGYSSPRDAESNPDLALSDDYILTPVDSFDLGGKEWVYDEDREAYYPMYGNQGPNFAKEFVYGAIVSGDCVGGLDVYDTTNPDANIIYTADPYDTIWLDMGFITKDDMIWAKVMTSTIPARNGFIHYKEEYKETLNVYLVDMPFEDILTDGAVDSAKIKAIKLERPDSNLKAPASSEPVRTMRMMRTAVAPVESASVSVATLSATPNAKTVTAIKATAKATTSNTKKSSSKKEANAAKKATVPTKNNTTKDTSKGPMELSAKNFVKKVQKQDPAIIQNAKKWPKKTSKKDSTGAREYDYSYHKSIKLDAINKGLAYTVRSPYSTYINMARKYNRFKQPIPDDSITRGFMHVFFVRPDCNFPLKSNPDKYAQVIKSDPKYLYVAKRRPDIVKQLVRKPDGYKGEFMNLLSNEVKGFAPIDESLSVDTYGKTRGGYSVAFARIKDSGLGGTFSITYTDTREMDILETHKLWIDYINNVYHGVWSPKIGHQINKELDYATAMYVILTAEDFETVVYWAKYYGVFPVNVPYSSLQWTYGSPITNPDLSVTYQYSWCRVKDPGSIAEFNNNTFGNKDVSNVKYVDTFDTKHGRPGETWVGRPFIELTKDRNKKIVYKLRFCK